MKSQKHTSELMTANMKNKIIHIFSEILRISDKNEIMQVCYRVCRYGAVE